MAPGWRREISALVGAPGLRLWLFDLSVEPEAAEVRRLTPAEQERAARFAFARDRRRYLAAHVHLRELLLEHALGADTDLSYAFGAQGKPRLAAAPTWHFNLGHGADTGVLALSAATELGVDIEQRRAVEDRADLARRCFTAEEQRELERAGAANGDMLFLQGWTRKEACLKAIGSGLSLEPAAFETGLAPRDRRLTLTWAGEPWHLALRSFQVDDTFGAVALRQAAP